MEVHNLRGTLAAWWSWRSEREAGGSTANLFLQASGRCFAGHCVDIEVDDATSLIVYNGCGFTETGSVTLVY